MKFPHVVKYNGVRYPAGAEVPVGDAVEEVKEPEPVPTKREIQTMKKAELIVLAEKCGIKNADTFSAAALKAELIEMFSF